MPVKTYIEPQTVLPVYDECDLLVVGGGAAGHSAAVAAARAGCKNIILMERYGYCGGDVTGSYVLMLPVLSWYDKSFVRGLQEEWIQRLEKVKDGVIGPSLDIIGKDDDPELLTKWSAYPSSVTGSKPRITRGMQVEPQQLKIELDNMLLEHSDSIRILYHTMGVKPIMDGNRVTGVIFESKEGRKAILAKQVVDATGDADLCRQTGGAIMSSMNDLCRCTNTALAYRLGGVSFEKFAQWRREHPAENARLSKGINKVAGYGAAIFPTPMDHVIWFNNWHPKKDCSKIADLTATEIEGRRTLRDLISYLQDFNPELFGNAYLLDIAPQTGVRGSCRIAGDYIMSFNDYAFARKHDDVIAWHSTLCSMNDFAPVEIPLRSILQKGVENISAPGRHLSADPLAIDCLNLIPQCVGTGQAAGVAAAVAITEGTTLRDVNIRKVQDILAGEQDVPLPRNSHTDISYTECCEEHQYGLYTEAVRIAVSKARDGVVQFFEWDTNGINH